jgi:hypothetical protein
MKPFLVNFLKPNKIKLVVFVLLFVLLIFFTSFRISYSLGWSQNANNLFLGLILSGPFLFIPGLGGFVPSIFWMYVISCIFSYFFKKKKLLTSTIFLVLIMIGLALNYNVHTVASDNDKQIFMQALKEENVDLCEGISPLAEVNGEELRRLIDISGTKLIINVLSYLDGYNLKDQCLMMEYYISWREWKQDNDTSDN